MKALSATVLAALLGVMALSAFAAPLSASAASSDVQAPLPSDDDKDKDKEKDKKGD